MPARHCAADVVTRIANALAAQAGTSAVTPRSRTDKEFAAQDWVADTLTAAGLRVRGNGRNSHPDLWVSAGVELVGVEVKSLAVDSHGRFSRNDLDFNSTVPGPTVDGHPSLTCFVGVAGTTIDTVSVCDTALINPIDQAQPNRALQGFGAYGDGRLRVRCMTTFPHPPTIAARHGQDHNNEPLDITGAVTMTVTTGSVDGAAAGWEHAGTIERAGCGDELVAFTVTIGEPAIGTRGPSTLDTRFFDVWHVPSGIVRPEVIGTLTVDPGGQLGMF